MWEHANFNASAGDESPLVSKSQHDSGLYSKRMEQVPAPRLHLARHLDSLASDDDGDEMLDEAIAIVKEAQKASASLLQRRLKVGYARAARLLDLMEAAGLIGPGDGAKARGVAAHPVGREQLRDEE